MPVGVPGPGEPLFLGRSRTRCRVATWARGLSAEAGAADAGVARVRGCGGGAERERERERDGQDLENTTEGKTVLEFGKDEKVFSQGDTAEAIYFIQRGKVKMTVVSEGGNEAVLRILPRLRAAAARCVGPLGVKNLADASDASAREVPAEAFDCGAQFLHTIRMDTRQASKKGPISHGHTVAWTGEVACSEVAKVFWLVVPVLGRQSA